MRTGIVAGVIAALLALLLAVGNGIDKGPNPFVVLGIMNGAVFALVALGLVLVYKGARVFNFAQGELGTLAAYFAWKQVTWEVPYLLAIVTSVILVTLIGLLIERLMVRPLFSAPRVTVLVATIAAALLLIGLEILFFRIEPQSLRPLIEAVGPDGELRGITLFDLPVEPQRLLILGVLAALGAGLAYFFSRTDLGLAVLATSQDSFATRVVGIGVERMSMFIWGTAAALGAIAGILYVPLTGTLVPAVMTSNILIAAFTAAVLGGMTSLPGAFLGGIVVGVVQSVALWAGNHFHLTTTEQGIEVTKTWQEIVPGLEWVAIITVLLLVLMVRPAGLLGRET
jgi:branched-chain amino acid transport system permease protein